MSDTPPCRNRKRFFDCTKLTLAEADDFGKWFAELQRDIMFYLGDLARYTEARWPETWHQAFPDWVSPGLLSRAAGVCRAYPTEAERQHDCTYSQYMQVAGKPDRQERLRAMVDQGLTSDESRKAQQQETTGPRWLLAVDVNYFLHRFWYSGAAVESAVGVADWVKRTAERLQAKGLTDVVCCFDSKTNHRKEFTKEWDDKYKDRPAKPTELGQQLDLVYELLKGHGFACVQIEGMEADDVMASCAKQFDGKVTLLTQDKDCRQCLSDKCNMLLDVEWTTDETTGDSLPQYKWLSAKQHTEATGLTPEQWISFQVIRGDPTDGITGAPNIGETGAANLIKAFGSVEDSIKAAREEDPRLIGMKRGKIMAKGLLELEPKLEVTTKLVRLVDDLPIPQATRI